MRAEVGGRAHALDHFGRVMLNPSGGEIVLITAVQAAPSVSVERGYPWLCLGIVDYDVDGSELGLHLFLMPATQASNEMTSHFCGMRSRP